MGMVITMVQFPKTKLDEYLNQPENFEKDLNKLESNSIDKSLYLDKSWEGIHFILTGKRIGEGDEPLALTIYGNQFFDEEQELGMGPASYLTPEQVKDISNRLADFDRNKLMERYTPRKMDQIGIYPVFWSKNSDELFEYIFENFSALQIFFKDAASKEHAIASYLG